MPVAGKSERDFACGLTPRRIATELTEHLNID
jgi:hypothetical protein